MRPNVIVDSKVSTAGNNGSSKELEMPVNPKQKSPVKDVALSKKPEAKSFESTNVSPVKGDDVSNNSISVSDSESETEIDGQKIRILKTPPQELIKAIEKETKMNELKEKKIEKPEVVNQTSGVIKQHSTVKEDTKAETKNVEPKMKEPSPQKPVVVNEVQNKEQNFRSDPKLKDGIQKDYKENSSRFKDVGVPPPVPPAKIEETNRVTKVKEKEGKVEKPHQVTPKIDRPQNVPPTSVKQPEIKQQPPIEPNPVQSKQDVVPKKPKEKLLAAIESQKHQQETCTRTSEVRKNNPSVGVSITNNMDIKTENKHRPTSETSLVSTVDTSSIKKFENPLTSSRSSTSSTKEYKPSSSTTSSSKSTNESSSNNSMSSSSSSNAMPSMKHSSSSSSSNQNVSKSDKHQSSNKQHAAPIMHEKNNLDLKQISQTPFSMNQIPNYHATAQYWQIDPYAYAQYPQLSHLEPAQKSPNKFTIDLATSMAHGYPIPYQNPLTFQQQAQYQEQYQYQTTKRSMEKKMTMNNNAEKMHKNSAKTVAYDQLTGHYQDMMAQTTGGSCARSNNTQYSTNQSSGSKSSSSKQKSAEMKVQHQQQQQQQQDNSSSCMLAKQQQQQQVRI